MSDEISSPAYFALSVAPSPPLVTPVRRFVEHFFATIRGPRATRDRVSIACYELLDNAIRYCADGETDLRVGLMPVGSDWLVTVRTRNRASERDVARAVSILERLSDDDPMPVYVEIMREAVGRDDATGAGAGLGLARVRAEGGMKIAWEVTGNELEIRAEVRTSPEDTQ